jgi:hypothetical protein
MRKTIKFPAENTAQFRSGKDPRSYDFASNFACAYSADFNG